ncbi:MULTISPECIES: hypothetical protein [unclassified Butyrivibrio]|uniref:hypothetical protein n=1 Tax=unclassified Butyrivibrio TaxID=2639466 RepID=UPI0003B63B61|nr:MULTISPECIES: hypothetical protein [unclassified Butyrivibrio]MDC7293968.1 hypothetical protein [Butyrivibrio sp. DSM 10294]
MSKKGFCEFYKKLYWGASVKKHTVVKWKLWHGSGQFGIFCITRATNGIDQLDIINCAFLKQPYFRQHPVYIYGIAGGYEEAMDIVLRISQEASLAGKDGRLLEYLDSVG